MLTLLFEPRMLATVALQTSVAQSRLHPPQPDAAALSLQQLPSR